MRYTVGQLKNLYSWVSFLNLAPSDPRWLMLLNEAVERLMSMGPWVGTIQRYRICTTNACLTWPRQFNTIEVVDVCGNAVTIRNQWFEFLDQGPGMWRGRCGSVGCSTINYLDRGRGYVMFDDPRVYCYLRFITEFASDAGKRINVRGYDQNQQWVLTANGNTAGEDVVLTANYVDTETVWMPQVFREIIKDKTIGHVRCYYYAQDDPYITGLNPDGSPHPVNPALVSLTPLAVWEPSETIPNYRRCVIPMLQHNGDGGSVTKPAVTVMAKLAFIPLESDLDVIPLTNAPAIKMAMLSVLKQERGDTEGARAAMHGTYNPITQEFEDGAVPLLEKELEAFQGSGSVVPLRLVRGFDNAGVLNLI